jgi:hypothetical protein
MDELENGGIAPENPVAASNLKSVSLVVLGRAKHSLCFSLSQVVGTADTARLGFRFEDAAVGGHSRRQPSYSATKYKAFVHKDCGFPRRFQWM